MGGSGATTSADNNGKTAAAPRMQDEDSVRGMSWNYGAISRAECDVLLNDRGVDGDFLIRESETNVSTYIRGSTDCVGKCRPRTVIMAQ